MKPKGCVGLLAGLSVVYVLKILYQGRVVVCLTPRLLLLQDLWNAGAHPPFFARSFGPDMR